jgi:hypothetical protein
LTQCGRRGFALVSCDAEALAERVADGVSDGGHQRRQLHVADALPALRMLRVRHFEPRRMLLWRNITSRPAPKLALSFFLHISAAIGGLNLAS